MKIAILALLAATLAGPAIAAATKTTMTKTTTTAKPMATRTMTATHTTKTGKTITYDCSKKGNATKTACKKKMS